VFLGVYLWFLAGSEICVICGSSSASEGCERLLDGEAVLVEGPADDGAGEGQLPQGAEVVQGAYPAGGDDGDLRGGGQGGGGRPGGR